MKKTLISLLALAAFADAKSYPLPFVGKAWFNFSGGNGTQEYIIIKNTGRTEIGMCGTAGCSPSYQGPFAEYIDVDGNGASYYRFTATQVTMFDSRKQVYRGCNESGIFDDGVRSACRQELTFDYKENRASKKMKIDQSTVDNYAYELLGGRYFTNGAGAKLWDTGDLIKKTNSRGIRIYCLSDMSVCKTEAEVMEYFNQQTR